MLSLKNLIQIFETDLIFCEGVELATLNGDIEGLAGVHFAYLRHFVGCVGCCVSTHGALRSCVQLFLFQRTQGIDFYWQFLRLPGSNSNQFTKFLSTLKTIICLCINPPPNDFLCEAAKRRRFQYTHSLFMYIFIIDFVDHFVNNAHNILRIQPRQ